MLIFCTLYHSKYPQRKSRTCTVNMGNSNGKKVLTEDDKAFIGEHTSVTPKDVAMYENFLLKHPDGNISRKEFRLLAFNILW